jgi:hypothetical protein
VWRSSQLMQSTVVGPHTSADIFSFGRLLFKILTGTRPSQGWHPREIITAARCQVALLTHWPVVPLADGVRTISENCTHVELRLRPGIFELQKTLRVTCVDCWPVDSRAVPLKEAVAELRRIDTSRPGEGPPVADCVDRSSPGLSGTTRPLEPILEQEGSSLRWPSGRFTRLPAPSAVRRALFKR